MLGMDVDIKKCIKKLNENPTEKISVQSICSRKSRATFKCIL